MLFTAPSPTYALVKKINIKSPAPHSHIFYMWRLNNISPHYHEILGLCKYNIKNSPHTLIFLVCKTNNIKIMPTPYFWQENSATVLFFLIHKPHPFKNVSKKSKDKNNFYIKKYIPPTDFIFQTQNPRTNLLISCRLIQICQIYMRTWYTVLYITKQGSTQIVTPHLKQIWPIVNLVKINKLCKDSFHFMHHCGNKGQNLPLY